jgi:hypothetical protein
MITRRALPALLGALVWAQFEAPAEAETYVRVTTWITAEKYQNYRIRELEKRSPIPGLYGPEGARDIYDPSGVDAGAVDHDRDYPRVEG